MKPAIPQPIIITIGLTLYFRVPTKATRKMMQLTINEYISSLGELKFSVFINTRAADASSPTTAGRNPLNTASTAGCFWYFRKNLLITNIRMNEGSTTAKVAMTEPHILPVAVKPTYVAELIPIGPGVI
jgi:hypothetical protein